MGIIKYRIYDKQEKEYCEEPDFRWMLSRKGKLYNSENDEWHELGERYIVEFWTGEKDSKEVDIYEGDIFSRKEKNGRYIVVFKDSEFIGIAEDGDDWGRYTSKVSDICGYDKKDNFKTVVGNKHGTKHHQY